MSNKPWRSVQHISERVGPRGGEYWALTLECGHLEFRNKPRSRGPMLPAMVAMGKRYRIRSGSAPYRVRCLTCVIMKGTA